MGFFLCCICPFDSQPTLRARLPCMGGARSWGGERKCARSSTQENPGSFQCPSPSKGGASSATKSCAHPKKKRRRGGATICGVPLLPTDAPAQEEGGGHHPLLHSISPSSQGEGGRNTITYYHIDLPQSFLCYQIVLPQFFSFLSSATKLFIPGLASATKVIGVLQFEPKEIFPLLQKRGYPWLPKRIPSGAPLLPSKSPRCTLSYRVVSNLVTSAAKWVPSQNPLPPKESHVASRQILPISAHEEEGRGRPSATKLGLLPRYPLLPNGTPP